MRHPIATIWVPIADGRGDESLRAAVVVGERCSSGRLGPEKNASVAAMASSGSTAPEITTLKREVLYQRAWKARSVASSRVAVPAAVPTGGAANAGASVYNAENNAWVPASPGSAAAHARSSSMTVRSRRHSSSDHRGDSTNSAIKDKASRHPDLGKTTEKRVESRNVRASISPPKRSTKESISPAPRRWLVLKTRCSTACATPSLPSALPARTRISIPTSGLSGAGTTQTRTPERTVRRTGFGGSAPRAGGIIAQRATSAAA